MITDLLFERAQRLRLHGLIENWDEIQDKQWLALFLQWEESARHKRSLSGVEALHILKNLNHLPNLIGDGLLYVIVMLLKDGCAWILSKMPSIQFFVVLMVLARA